MARGKTSSVIESLSGDLSDRTYLAKEIATVCMKNKPSEAHPDKLYVCYILSSAIEIETGRYKIDSAQTYSRFVLFVCDLWQLMIFGLID